MDLALCWALVMPLVKIDFGELQGVFIGLLQAALPIIFVLFLIGILLMFFPQGRIFLGKLVGRG